MWNSVKRALWFGFLSFMLVASIQAEEDIIEQLIPHIIACESSGNPNAISEDGCIGLMQISPIVLEEFKEWWKQHDGGIVTLTLEDLYDEINNKMVGTWYLHRLKDHYLKDNFTIERLLAAYNMGPTRLKRLNYEWWRIRETKRYVKKVLKLYQKEKQ